MILVDNAGEVIELARDPVVFSQDRVLKVRVQVLELVLDLHGCGSEGPLNQHLVLLELPGRGGEGPLHRLLVLGHVGLERPDLLVDNLGEVIEAGQPNRSPKVLVEMLAEVLAEVSAEVLFELLKLLERLCELHADLLERKCVPLLQLSCPCELLLQLGKSHVNGLLHIGLGLLQLGKGLVLAQTKGAELVPVIIEPHFKQARVLEGLVVDLVLPGVQRVLHMAGWQLTVGSHCSNADETNGGPWPKKDTSCTTPAENRAAEN